MDHIGEVVFCYFNGKGFNFAGPECFDPDTGRGQREAPDSVEETSHGQQSLFPFHHFTAAAMVLVVFTTVCAV